MAIKSFREQKFRKKDGLPYGYNREKVEQKIQAKYNYSNPTGFEQDEELDELAELRKARSDASMQRLINSDEYKRKQQELRQGAIELAKGKANAGGDRTTESRLSTITDYAKEHPLQVGASLAGTALKNSLERTTVGRAISIGVKGQEFQKKASDYLTTGEKGETTEELLEAAKKRNAAYDENTKKLFDDLKAAKQEYATQYDSSGYAYEEEAARNKIIDIENQLKASGLTDKDIKQYEKDQDRINNAVAEEERKGRINEKLREGGKKGVANNVLYAAGDVLSSTVAGFPAVANAIGAKIKGENVDTNSRAWTLANINKDIEEIQNDIIVESVDKKVGKEDSWQGQVAGYGYGVGMSTAKSLTAMAIGGQIAGAIGAEAGLSTEATTKLANTFTLPGFGANAAAESVREGQNRGLNSNQILATSLAAGFFEMFFEQFSLDHAWDIVKNNNPRVAKNMLVNLLVQGGIEGSEEGATDIANWIADYLINGKLSEYEQVLSETGSKRDTYLYFAKQLGLDMLAGFISGEVAGLGYSAANMHYQTKGGRAMFEDKEGMQDALENPQSPNYISPNEEDYESEEAYTQAIAARNELQKAVYNQKITGKQARSLFSDVQQAYVNKDKQQKSEFQSQTKTEEPEEAEEPENTTEEYQAPEKTQEEIISDIEFASTPYELAKALEYVEEETDEIKELVAFKRDELKMYGATEEELDNVITPKKAFEMGQRGEEITEDQLASIPQNDRQEVLESNNQQYNKAILAEHKDAVTDTKNGKYFVPSEVKVKGNEIVVVDSEGHEHADFSSPKIKAANNAISVVSKDARTGNKTGQSLYNVTVKQSADVTELAIKSTEANSIQLNSAVKAIFQVASVGNRTWSAFENKYQYMFDVIDKNAAKTLFDQVRSDARISDRVKTKGTAGKRTSNETVSKTLRENLPEETVALLEAFGNKIGYNFVASTNKEARGDILPSKRQISIGQNNLSEVYAITSHEGIAEYLQAHGNEDEVLDIQDTMLSYLQDKMGEEQYQNLINLYQSVYRTGAKSEIDANKSRRAAANEMFADTVWTLFASEEGLNDFVGWVTDTKTASEQVSIFTKIKDFFSKIYDAIRNYIEHGSLNEAEMAALEMDVKQAKELRDRIFIALDHAIENAKASEGTPEEHSSRNALDLRFNKWKNVKVAGMPDAFKGAKIRVNDSISKEELDQLQEDFIHNFSKQNFQKHDYLISDNHIARIFSVTDEKNFKVSEIESKQGFIKRIVEGKVYEQGTENGRTYYRIPNRVFNVIQNDKEFHNWYSKYITDSRAEGLSIKLFQSHGGEQDTANKGTNKGSNENDSNSASVEDLARHSFAGIGSETADIHQLNRADDMREEGIDEETILASTGWFLGMDNQWKYEIPDNDLIIFKDGNAQFLRDNKDFQRYNELMDKIFFKSEAYSDEEYDELVTLEDKVLKPTQNEGVLPDFVQHDRLFEAYPFLRETYVDFVDFDSDTTNGSADIYGNGIHLNKNFHTSVSGKWSEGAMKSVLLHEIQHLIQRREDFANGASPEYWNEIKNHKIEEDKKAIENAKAYLNRAIEGAKKNGTPTSIREFVFDLSDRLDAGEITQEEYNKQMARFKKSSVYHYENMIYKLERHVERLSTDSNNLLYYNTAGEIEARDASNRAHLTAEQRRQYFPKVDDKDVVYIDRGVSGRRFSIKIDSAGRELSEGQQEYFKDSKVVDEEGNLRVVYHGTMADFTIFDLNEARDTEDIEAFFFSGDYDESNGYGNVGEYYLNITNPADYDTAYDIFFKYKGQEHAGRLAREELMSLGYDGVIAAEEGEEEYTEYLAFYPEQIKKVSNLNPTDNPDIRKSIKVDNLGRNIAPGMQQYLKDNADAFFDENGAVKNYYHGSRHAGFTAFSLDMMDDQRSIFLTDTKDVAKTYSGTHEMFEPDREWSFNELENAISFFTGGDWEIERTDSGVEITELGFIGQEGTKTNFGSVKEAQEYFVDWIQTQDMISGGDSGAIYNVYVHSTNPLVIDARNQRWDEIEPWEYDKHLIDVNITKNDDVYEVDYANVEGEYFHETYDSRKDFEENFSVLPEDYDIPDEGEYYEDLYLDKDRNIIPSNTRAMSAYAKEHGYDSLVINNVIDSGLFGSTAEQNLTSQVVVVFDPSQVKSVYNENPSSDDEDIRKSIKVDWDNKNTYKLPDRTYDDDIFFLGTDEEIEAAEKQEITAKAYVANIIHSKDFAGLMFRDSIGMDRLLTRSTRPQWDWQLTESRNGEPIGHENYKEVNDDITSYDTWPDKTMAALYNEIINELPKTDAVIHVIREGIAEDARQSIKVYGEASPYADSINETKTITALIGSMNNALSKADVFEVPNDELIRIERYINNKYKVEGIEEGEIAANVAYTFAYMQKNKLDTDYEVMMNYLLNIGDEVIKHSNLKDPETEKIYQDTRAQLMSHKIKLTDADRAEISNAFGGSWKAAFGALQKAGIKLDNKNGVSIDNIFSEIKQEVLESAGVDISYGDKPSEQILALIDTMTALEPTAYLWDGANDMDKALTVVTDIVQQYYTTATEQLESNVVKGTQKGKDALKKAVEKEKARLRGEWSKYKTTKTEEFNELVAEKNQVIQQQQNEIKRQNELLKTWEKDMAQKDKELSRRTTLSDKEIKATARLQAKQAVQSYKDRQERAKQIENIKKTGIRLIKWLTNPSDTQHVPQFLQRPLGEFLAAIDFLPKNSKADSKSTLSWHQRMNELREELVRIKNAEEEGNNDVRAYFAQNIVAKELISMMDDFLGKEEWDEFTQSYVLTKRKASKVSNLDAKDLATLNKIMSALSASINNLNKTYANDQFKEISKLAKESVKEVDSLPAKKDMQRLMGQVFNFLNFDELEPITYFEGLGKGAKSVFDELREGFNVKTKHVRESDEYMAKAKEELGISDKELSTWKNQLHKFNLAEGTVMLNTTQIMTLYETLKRRQGKPHVAVGGIKAADFEYKDGKIMKKHHQAKAVHIMSSEAQAIIDTLTDEQKALADKMQQYMASECASWGNRVTEKMYGYKKYEEEDYFPLRTDAHSRATTASSDNNVSYYTIKNASFTKPITPMANNAVVLEDIFDVFTNHVVSMADYDAYVMPIADAMRWFNYSERMINAVAPDELNEQGARMDYIGNMQESIDRVYGDAGLKYFRQFIKDINGDYAGRGGKSEIQSTLMSMYKAQAVGANMRVVIQQPTAVVRAADVIEKKYLLQAMASLPKATEYAKKAQANSEIAYWKAQGYYETYLGQSFKEIITGDTTFKDRMNDWSGYLAGAADDLSWGIMYHAAELKVKDTMPQLKEGTAAFDAAATKIFEEIVDHTQVVDTIFHKSQWMRSQELFHKSTSAFMAEPTKTYNMLYRAYRDAKLSGNRSYAMKRLRDTAFIFLIEQLLNAMVTGAWDVLRDDEKKDYISSFKEHFTENAFDNFNPLNLLPIAKELISAWEGWSATDYSTEGIYSFVGMIRAFPKLGKTILYNANKIIGSPFNIDNEGITKTGYGAVYQIAKAISQLSGVPIANVMREIKTLYNTVNDFWGGKDLVNTIDAEKKSTKSKETNRLKKVFATNDLSTMKAEVTNTYTNALQSGKSEADAWKASRDMLKEQYLVMIAEHPEDKAAINNRFKTLLKYTKQSDGKGGMRDMTDKEIANRIEGWMSAAE